LPGERFLQLVSPRAGILFRVISFISRGIANALAKLRLSDREPCVEACGPLPITSENVRESRRGRHYPPDALDASAKVAKLPFGRLLVRFSRIIGQSARDVPLGEP
jgi:hypothetical protein